MRMQLFSVAAQRGGGAVQGGDRLVLTQHGSSGNDNLGAQGCLHGVAKLEGKALFQQLHRWTGGDSRR